MKDDKENDIEMNNGDSAEAPADENNMQANPESEKKPHNRKVIAAICGLALVALIGGGAYYGISHQTGADSKAEPVQANDSKESGSDASTKDSSKSKEKSHTHDWSITYKTVHHDAVTHPSTRTRPPTIPFAMSASRSSTARPMSTSSRPVTPATPPTSPSPMRSW